MKIVAYEAYTNLGKADVEGANLVYKIHRGCDFQMG